MYIWLLIQIINRLLKGWGMFIALAPSSTPLIFQMKSVQHVPDIDKRGFCTLHWGLCKNDPSYKYKAGHTQNRTT